MQLLKFSLKPLVLFSCISIFISGCIETDVESTDYVYGNEVERLANQFNLPSDYLKALITLECSGRRNVPPRFEKHVYAQLKAVRNGTRKSYEGIYADDLKDASDEALKNLSKSWGPFQLMGYKCLHLKIKIDDVRGSNALYWGVKWINDEYGLLLRSGRFEEAFRKHNTGSPTGRTHDPGYVSKGLRHMQYFKNQ
ncbi:MAG: hypothetical protein ACKOQ6_11335 [Bacteroidota bacterium]